MDNTSL